MKVDRYNEIYTLLQRFNKFSPNKLPFEILKDINDDGILMVNDECFQGTAMRFIRETKISHQELKEWGLMWYQIRQEARMEELEEEERMEAQ